MNVKVSKMSTYFLFLIINFEVIWPENLQKLNHSQFLKVRNYHFFLLTNLYKLCNIMNFELSRHLTYPKRVQSWGRRPTWTPSGTRPATAGWATTGSTAIRSGWWWGYPRLWCRIAAGPHAPTFGGHLARPTLSSGPSPGCRSGCLWWLQCARVNSRPKPRWRSIQEPENMRF